MVKRAIVLAATAALVALAAPASATEAAAPLGPEDAAGCTTVLVGEANGWIPWSMPSEPVKVEYVPPGTVNVDADYPVGVVTNIAGDVVAWVICVA